MNINRTEISPTVLIVALCFVLVCSGRVHSQEQSSAPRKFDEFKDERTSNIKAYLDLFAQQLVKDPSLEGVIVGYREEDWLPGSFLRYVHGFREYLVNMRGVDPARAKVINAGVREETMTQLWLIPSGASFPFASQDKASGVDTVMQWDQLTMGPGCESEYTLVLEEPGDALKFFAGALRDNPTHKGFILVRPSKSEPLHRVEKRAVNSKHVLVSEYRVEADRISAQVERRRLCSEIDLWLASPNLLIPKTPRVGSFFQSRLMAEAEQNQYSVRRITLLGNTYTRDNVIRRRLLQNEGDIFRRTLLEQSLRSISKLRNFSPVSLQDVEVRLDRKEKIIDFLINLTERTSSRKRRN